MGAASGRVSTRLGKARGRARTDDERDHAGAVATGGLEALDELLDLPYLDVLLGVVRLRGTHDGDVEWRDVPSVVRGRSRVLQSPVEAGGGWLKYVRPRAGRRRQAATGKAVDAVGLEVEGERENRVTIMGYVRQMFCAQSIFRGRRRLRSLAQQRHASPSRVQGGLQMTMHALFDFF